MRGNILWGFGLMCLFILGGALNAGASVVINEIFADPGAGLTGDANNDGVRSGTQDEFVELLNNSGEGVDLSGWRLSDSVSTRHIFPADTFLDPYAYLAVFGGGAPALLKGDWQVASSGTLGLNNASDTVSLWDASEQLIDQVTYGEIGNHDQSFTLFPEGAGETFMLHSALEDAQGALFSPGTRVDSQLTLVVLSGNELLGDEGIDAGDDPLNNPVVPEWPTLVYVATGLLPMLGKRLW